MVKPDPATRRTIACTALSPGTAAGTAFIYRDILTREISHYDITRGDIGAEMDRITDSFTEVKNDLRALSRSVSGTIDRESGGIFDAQRMMLEDDEFIYEMEKEMRAERVNAEQVTKNVFRKYINRFDESSSDVLRTKADDMRDILRKVLRNLLGIETSSLEDLPAKTILVTRRLLPSDTINLDRDHITGIVVQEGSIHSHSALLARSLGIAAVYANDPGVLSIPAGTPLVVNADAGKLLVNPAPATFKKYAARRTAAQRQREAPVIRKQVSRSDGTRICVQANANTRDEVAAAFRNGCDGIGLFRLESLYMESRAMPTEEELHTLLERIVTVRKHGRYTVRLLDIGGDKRLPYLDAGDEISPFLGVRGIRYLLKNPELLKLQLRVLCRLARTCDLHILVPMVTLPAEVADVRALLHELAHGDDAPPLGIMVETPAAALDIRALLPHSDFVSIGTNDLTQYVMAAGRENPDVAEYYDAGTELVHRLSADIARAARDADTECAVCGEMAGEYAHLERFMEAGIRHFSVSSFMIPELKARIRKS